MRTQAVGTRIWSVEVGVGLEDEVGLAGEPEAGVPKMGKEGFDVVVVRGGGIAGSRLRFGRRGRRLCLLGLDRNGAQGEHYRQRCADEAGPIELNSRHHGTVVNLSGNPLSPSEYLTLLYSMVLTIVNYYLLKANNMLFKVLRRD